MSDQALATIQATEPLHPEIIEKLVLDGDVAALQPMQRVDYYVYRCRQLGIDPAEMPFQLIKLDGKLTLYPKKECAQALTRIYRLSVAVLSKTIDEDGMMTVSARASGPDGSFVDDDGVLDLNGIDVVGGVNKYGKQIPGIGRANAMMKCVTKAKRRAVLAKCGLGGVDADDIPGARVYNMNLETGAIDEDNERQPAIEAGPTLSPTDRLIAIIATIAQAHGVEKRTIYRAGLDGADIPVQEYDGWPAPDQLTPEDAAAVANWLELNRKMKRSESTDAKPRSRARPTSDQMDDEGRPHPDEEPPF